MTTYTYSFKTEKQGFIKLDSYLNQAITESGIQNGIAVIFCPHTTAAVTINENTDPNVGLDILHGIDILSPVRHDYLHLEGNSHAHLKSSLIGPSELIIVENGRPALGPWQNVYFCEFDGPRTRRVVIKLIAG